MLKYVACISISYNILFYVVTVLEVLVSLNSVKDVTWIFLILNLIFSCMACHIYHIPLSLGYYNSRYGILREVIQLHFYFGFDAEARLQMQIKSA